MTDTITKARALAGEAVFHSHGAGSYKISANDARLIALAVNVLPALLDVLAATTRRHGSACPVCLVIWSRHENHDEHCPVPKALAALDRELGPEEPPR